MLIDDTKQPNPNMVNVYDFKTETVSTIPARELAPGMVQARIEGIGVDGPVWVDAREAEVEMQPSPFRHSSFDAETLGLIDFIRRELEEMRPLSLDEWVDGFRRDTHPMDEIYLWIELALAYREATVDKGKSLEQKQDYYRLFLSCINNPRDQVLRTTELEVLSLEEAERAIAQFFSARAARSQ